MAPYFIALFVGGLLLLILWFVEKLRNPQRSNLEMGIDLLFRGMLTLVGAGLIFYLSGLITPNSVFNQAVREIDPEYRQLVAIAVWTSLLTFACATIVGNYEAGGTRVLREKIRHSWYTVSCAAVCLLLGGAMGWC